MFIVFYQWKQEITKIPEWPNRKAIAEFRLCVGHDCLGTHLHCTGIRPDRYCMLCSLREPMDRNHLGKCTALFNRTECERYWDARTKWWKTDFASFPLLFLWPFHTTRTFIFTLNAVYSIYSVISGVPRGGGGFKGAPPRNSEGSPKSCQTQPDCENR